MDRDRQGRPKIGNDGQSWAEIGKDGQTLSDGETCFEIDR